MPNVANMVAIDNLIFADNVRTDACLQLPAMVASITRHGFKVNHPLVVSTKADGTFLVLCGNRRGLALVSIRDTDPDTFHRITQGGKVPAIVHSGLTVEEEVLLRIDHSKDEDRVPLDSWSEFMAIRQLAQVGIDSQEKIAEKLGIFYAKGKNAGQPNRSYVQPRLNLARLPGFVQEQFEAYCDDVDSSPVRWSMVAGLYKVFNGEYLEHPEGNGPLFTEAWAKAMTPPDQKPKVDRRAFSPADAHKRAQAANSPLLSQALLSVTGQSETPLTTIDSKIIAAVEAQNVLAMIRTYLGEVEYIALESAAREQALIQAEPDNRTEEEIGAETETCD